jgi:hypothetical protein
VRLAVAAAAVAVLLAGCDGDSVKEDTRDIEKAYYALRDALLQADDEAFFALHGSEARQWAIDSFPAIRAGYLAAGTPQREEFRRLYRVTDEEFLAGQPRDLVVRMMPWRSGWRERREMFRNARVKDVRIDYVPVEGGATERRGVVELEPREGTLPPGEPPPTVIFVKEKEGWRRRTFFTEEVHAVEPPKRPDR